MKTIAIKLLFQALEMLLSPTVFKELGDMVLDNIESWAAVHPDPRTQANVMRLCSIVRDAFNLPDDDQVNYGAVENLKKAVSEISTGNA